MASMAFFDYRMHFCLLLFNLIICITCVHSAKADQCDTTSSTGKDFVFGLIGGYTSAAGNYINLMITSTTNTTTNVRIVVPVINMDETRTFSNSTVVSLTSNLQTSGTYHQFKAIQVFSDSDISLVAMFINSDSTEGFLVLPTSALGTRYIAASYHPYSSFKNELLIIGTEHNTDVLINYSFVNGTIVSNAIKIVAYETYQLSFNYDISGAVITSNEPVAVISGSGGSRIPVNAGNYQALMEQLVPVKYWGHKYIVPPIYPHNFFILRIFAYENETDVDIHNSTRHVREFMNHGSVMELEFGSSPVVIESTKPIQVVQYNMDNELLTGNPFMTTTPSITQFTGSYDFIVPNNYRFITTVVITIDKTNVSGLRLDGRPLTTLNPATVAVPDPMHQYVTIFANISYTGLSSPHNLQHNESGVYFGATLYGAYSTGVAFGYPLGFTLHCNTDPPSQATTNVIAPTTHTAPTTSTQLNVGNTTNVHHPGNPQQHGNGTWCFQCQDMYSLTNCDIVTRCSSDNQVCFVQRYKQSNSYDLYRSGCTDKHTCGTENSGAECHECCDGQFCNTHGCGDAGVDSLQERGPLCFDCAYQSDGQLCHTVQLCATNQVCSIEMHAWGNGIRHTKGCVNQLSCDSRIGRSVNTRSTPLCSTCCSTDFCNEKCSPDSSPSIIG